MLELALEPLVAAAEREVEPDGAGVVRVAPGVAPDEPAPVEAAAEPDAVEPELADEPAEDEPVAPAVPPDVRSVFCPP